jgi:transposase
MKGLTLTAKEQARLQILNGVLEHHWTTQEAALLLGVSERQAWRLLAAYRKEGAAALAHGNRGRLPSNHLPAALRDQVVTLVRERYSGVNYIHLVELLAEREQIVLSRSTVRRLLVQAGLASLRRRRPPQHRQRRQRMPQAGMLLQLDGSHHAWLEDRGPWLTLLLAVDDATGTAPYALFREQEDTHGYFELLQGILERQGVPLGVYTDRHAVFQSRGQSAEAAVASPVGRQLTQFGRALQELGIRQVFAYSPEAKGRVERMNGTFQDRLVTELRLAGAATLARANQVLWDFLPRFNQRFGVPPGEAAAAYRPLGANLDLASVLCIKEWRRVGRDNTVQYQGRTFQLFPDPQRPSYARTRVEVQERLDGCIVVVAGNTLLTPRQAPPLAATLRTPAALPERPDRTPAPAPDAAPQGVAPVLWHQEADRQHHHQPHSEEGRWRSRWEDNPPGRPRVSDRIDVAWVKERRAQGDSWRQLARTHPAVRSASGRMVQPSLSSLRRALGFNG